MVRKHLHCELCGAKNFTRLNGLHAHQRSPLCIQNRRQHDSFKPASEASDRGVKRKATDEHGAGPSSTVPEFAGTNVEDDFDSLYDLDESEGTGKAAYNSTLALVNWIRHCRSTIGLSNSDIQSLFKGVLFHPSFALNDVNVRSVSELVKYEESLLTKGENWLTHVVHLEDGDVGETMYYRNPIEALKTLFSSPKVSSKFSSHANIDAFQRRLYSTPNTANWWNAMEVKYFFCHNFILIVLQMLCF